jgi:hypothetical protein
MTLTMSGLIIGQSYAFQTWVNDSRDFNGFVFSVDVTAGNTVTLDPNSGVEGSLGEYVLGTFTADAVFQQIEYFGSEVGVVNGFQLRELQAPSGVPEAGSTIALFGFAVLGLSVFSRKTASQRRA